jgi:beta-glucosidase
MDNFEWACGFGQRFGLIHVDYETQRRRMKLSGEIFAEVARSVNRPPRPAT